MSESAAADTDIIIWMVGCSLEYKRLTNGAIIPH